MQDIFRFHQSSTNSNKSENVIFKFDILIATTSIRRTDIFLFKIYPPSTLHYLEQLLIIHRSFVNINYTWNIFVQYMNIISEPFYILLMLI